MNHELKTWPDYFHEVFMGHKNFDIRKNDRDFNSNTSFHFATDKQAYNFVELLKIAD